MPRTTNVAVTAIRLFYDSVLGQPEKVAALRCRQVPNRLPRTMPEEDVEHLIQAMIDMRYRTATLVAYGAARRVCEVVSLQIPDIRRNEGLPQIRKGKGNRERMAYLPAAVLGEQERYRKTTWPRPESWLFYRKAPDEPITVRGLQTAFGKARDQIGLDRGLTFHCLRHAAATHLLERDASQSVVKDVLGTQVSGDHTDLCPHHVRDVPLARPSGGEVPGRLIPWLRCGGHHHPRRARLPRTPHGRSRRALE